MLYFWRFRLFLLFLPILRHFLVFHAVFAFAPHRFFFSQAIESKKQYSIPHETRLDRAVRPWLLGLHAMQGQLLLHRESTQHQQIQDQSPQYAGQDSICAVANRISASGITADRIVQLSSREADRGPVLASN